MSTEQKKGSNQKGKATPKADNSKAESQKKREWNKVSPGNIEHVIEGKFLVMKINLKDVVKPSSSFYAEGSKKKTNILVATTGGNRALLNGEYNDLRISVNIYRPMTESEIEEYSKTGK